MPARLWFDLDGTEKLYVNARKAVEKRERRVSAIVAKYQKLRAKMNCQRVRFCAKIEHGYEWEWLGIEISETGGYGTHWFHDVDFQVTPKNLPLLYVPGDKDLLDLIYDGDVYHGRGRLQQIMIEGIHDRYLKRREGQPGDVAILATKHFSFVFHYVRQYDHGPNEDLIWKHMLGPTPNDGFTIINAQNRGEAKCV